jgi:hypothetical protein
MCRVMNIGVIIFSLSMCCVWPIHVRGMDKEIARQEGIRADRDKTNKNGTDAGTEPSTLSLRSTDRITVSSSLTFPANSSEKGSAVTNNNDTRMVQSVAAPGKYGGGLAKYDNRDEVEWYSTIPCYFADWDTYVKPLERIIDSPSTIGSYPLGELEKIAVLLYAWNQRYGDEAVDYAARKVATRILRRNEVDCKEIKKHNIKIKTYEGGSVELRQNNQKIQEFLEYCDRATIPDYVFWESVLTDSVNPLRDYIQHRAPRLETISISPNDDAFVSVVSYTRGKDSVLTVHKYEHDPVKNRYMCKIRQSIVDYQNVIENCRQVHWCDNVPQFERRKESILHHILLRGSWRWYNIDQELYDGSLDDQKQPLGNNRSFWLRFVYFLHTILKSLVWRVLSLN